MDTSRAAESFRDLLLRHRGRTGLTQLELAHRVGAGRRTLQDWEAGINHPSAELLRALIKALLEADGLTAGREAAEAEEVWAAVLRDAPRMNTPFDELWVASLLRERAAPGPEPEADHDGGTVAPVLRPAEMGGERRQDWGDAPDVLRFVGRHEELAMVRDWVVGQHCRVVSVLGIGGIGKTSIAAKLAKDVAPSFHRVYWRSLRNAPPVGEWLGDAIGFLSGQQVIAPRGEAARLAALLVLLRDRPNLLVLDNFETLLEPRQREGGYREGFAGYGALLRAIGETVHQSCLVVTSREAPPELAVLSGHPVRTLDLGGLGVPEGQVLLADKQLSGNAADWGNLIARFGGNGLALKLVGESIRQVFGGCIGAFINPDESGFGAVFGGIRRLLAEQIERSSVVEQEVLRVLAVEREPVTIGELIAELGHRAPEARRRAREVGPRAGRGAVVEAVEALRRRSLVEPSQTTTRAAAFTLQSVVLEYVTDRLVEEVSDEIARGQPLRLVEQPLIKAQAKDYVRQTQERLIGAPVLRHVTAQHGDAGAEQMLLALLEGWRNRPRGEQGYGPGNAVNLLRLLRGNLRGRDLAGLAIRQAYLAEVEAQDATLARAHLSEAVLAEAFNFPICVALSGDGASLVTGTSAGEVWLWRVADRTPLMAIQMRSGPVYAVALSADGKLLAGGGEDGTVRLWEVPGGRLLATLQGHTGAVRGLALSADGQLLASGSFDGTVRLWEVPSGRPLAALHGHTDAVWGVSLSANGQLLASSGQDGTVRLWEAATGRLVATWQGHTGAVWGVSLSADGRLLASGGQDATVRLWEAPGGRLVATLEGHTGGVWSVVLSADGRLLASGGLDGTVRLWGAPFATGDAVERWAGRTADSRDSAAALPSGGRLLATLQDDTNGVWGVALTADGQLLAGSSWDGTVRLWEAQSGRPLATLEGQTGGVYSVALSAKGWLLASSGQDGTARLWEAPFDGGDALERWAGQREDFEHSPAAPPIGKRLVATLRGHVGAVWGVSLGADGRLLASGGQDGTVRLWETHSGGPLATLHGHTGTVFGVSLSADGRLLASGGMDGTVRLWQAPSGQQVARLEGHTNAVRGVALSADGRLLASGSFDGTVRLWEAPSGRLLATLEGHTGGVWGVALSADGQLLASSGTSGIVQLWEAVGGRLAATLQGHTGTVWGVALSADGRLLASGGMDGTVRLWEAPSGRPLATLEGHTGGVWGVVLSADGRLLASGSFDGTVRLWEASSGAHLHTLRSDRRYERVDVTGLTGVTAAQRVSLLALGAVEPGQATEVSDGVPLSPF